MNLSAPKQTTWLIALILAVVAVLSYLGVIPIALLVAKAFIILLVAFVVLLLGTFLTGF